MNTTVVQPPPTDPLVDASGEQPTTGSWSHRDRWLPLSLIAIEVAILGWLISDSFFFADDLIMFSVSHADGLSWKTLGFNLYYHFAPIPWAFHLLVQEVAPLNYPFAAAVILILAATTLLALWWVLRQLEVPLVIILAVLGVVGSSPFLVNPALWFGEAVFLLPAVILMLLVLGFFIRWHRTGRRLNLFAALAFFVAALLVQEIPLLLVPALVLLRYWVLPRPTTAPGFWRWVWRDKWTWLGFAVIGAAYSWFFHRYYYGKMPSPSVLRDVQIEGLGAIRFGRGLLGTPIAGMPQWATIVVSVFLAVVVCAVIWAAIRYRPVRTAVVWFVVLFVLKQMALALGLAGKFEPAYLTSDPQRYIDLLVELAVATGLATSGWIWRATYGAEGGASAKTRSHPRHARESSSKAVAFWTSRRPPWLAARATLVVVLLVVAVHLVSVPSGIRSVKQGFESLSSARAFADNMQNGFVSIDRSGYHATVVPLLVPGFLAPNFIAPYNGESDLFELSKNWRNFDTGPVEIVDVRGNLVPIDLAGSSPALVNSPPASYYKLKVKPSFPGAVCATTGRVGGSLGAPLVHLVSGSPLVADLHFQTPRPFTLTVVVAHDRSLTVLPQTYTVAAGTSRLVVWLPGTVATGIGLNVASRASFCLGGVTVGTMVTAPAAGVGVCHSLDKYGAIGESVPCGRPPV